MGIFGRVVLGGLHLTADTVKLTVCFFYSTTEISDSVECRLLKIPALVLKRNGGIYKLYDGLEI